MDRLGIILRTVVFFLFPIPFLLSYAVSRGEDWTVFVAYVAIAILAVAAVGAAWVALGRED
jgi:hypothetical protein